MKNLCHHRLIPQIYLDSPSLYNLGVCRTENELRNRGDAITVRYLFPRPRDFIPISKKKLYRELKTLTLHNGIDSSLSLLLPTKYSHKHWK